MYSKDMLIGILLGIAKMDLHIERSSKAKLGYNAKVRLSIRGTEEFLLGVQRSLEQHQIKSNYKQREHNSRPKPILRIGGIKELHKVTKLVPNLPDAKGEWKDFRQAVHIMSNGIHKELKGMEILMKIKGVI
jgi:hypothetical protein|tara:strand:- start:871 stop:1266 length:396 start_codon:yes stop_codon:yes gene_type:complete